MFNTDFETHLESQSMDILDLERLVRRGAASLAEGLHFYWPSSNEDNKIHEMNITLHMGRALLESGFFAFPEASPPAGDVRLDLLGLHHPSKVALLCEFKCLDSPARAQEMIENVGRIKSFVLHTNPDLIHERLDTNSFQKFGLFAATTWDVGYANWFASASNNAPHRTLSPLWAATSHAALNNDLLWGSCPLSYSHDPTTNQASQHWLVYLLFPLPLFLQILADPRISRLQKRQLAFVWRVLADLTTGTVSNSAPATTFV